MKFSTYRKECVNNGGVVKNYALYHHEQTDSLMKKHQNELSNKEVDIAFVTDTKHKNIYLMFSKQYKKQVWNTRLSTLVLVGLAEVVMQS